jgi:hypothetical protein
VFKLAVDRVADKALFVVDKAFVVGDKVLFVVDKAFVVVLFVDSENKQHMVVFLREEQKVVVEVLVVKEQKVVEAMGYFQEFFVCDRKNECRYKRLKIQNLHLIQQVLFLDPSL